MPRIGRIEPERYATVVNERPYRPVPVAPVRKRWTRAECAALETSGVWNQQHLELIEGELIDKMGKNRPHVNTLLFVRKWLDRVFGTDYVSTEASIDVAPEDNPASEPQPDIVVLTRPSGEFPKNNPQPSDLRLVVETSDSSLRFDLTAKAASTPARAFLSTEFWMSPRGE
jgi:Putative restriction endonuclease